MIVSLISLAWNDSFEVIDEISLRSTHVTATVFEAEMVAVISHCSSVGDSSGRATQEEK